MQLRTYQTFLRSWQGEPKMTTSITMTPGSNSTSVEESDGFRKLRATRYVMPLMWMKSKVRRKLRESFSIERTKQLVPQRTLSPGRSLGELNPATGIWGNPSRNVVAETTVMARVLEGKLGKRSCTLRNLCVARSLWCFFPHLQRPGQQIADVDYKADILKLDS